jgi:hypothetical protein
MSLTETAVKNSKPRDKTYKLTDEKGLYVQVNPNGSKFWHLKFRFRGKEISEQRQTQRRGTSGVKRDLASQMTSIAQCHEASRLISESASKPYTVNW